MSCEAAAPAVAVSAVTVGKLDFPDRLAVLRVQADRELLLPLVAVLRGGQNTRIAHDHGLDTPHRRGSPSTRVSDPPSATPSAGRSPSRRRRDPVRALRPVPRRERVARRRDEQAHHDEGGQSTHRVPRRVAKLRGGIAVAGLPARADNSAGFWSIPGGNVWFTGISYEREGGTHAGGESGDGSRPRVGPPVARLQPWAVVAQNGLARVKVARLQQCNTPRGRSVSVSVGGGPRRQPRHS